MQFIQHPLDEVGSGAQRNLLCALTHEIMGSVTRMSVERAKPGGLIYMVEDDGSGTLPNVRGNVLLPVLTIRMEGSGVGLSLRLQTVVAHGGAVAGGDGVLGGAAVRVVL